MCNRTSIEEKTVYQPTKRAEKRVIESMKIIFPPFERKPKYSFDKNYKGVRVEHDKKKTES